MSGQLRGDSSLSLFLIMHPRSLKSLICQVETECLLACPHPRASEGLWWKLSATASQQQVLKNSCHHRSLTWKGGVPGRGTEENESVFPSCPGDSHITFLQKHGARVSEAVLPGFS